MAFIHLNYYHIPHLSKADKAADILASEARRRKEVALAGLRALQLRQVEGKLLSATQVEQAWAGAVSKLRNRRASDPEPVRRAIRRPKTCEQVIRRGRELALKQIAGKSWGL